MSEIKSAFEIAMERINKMSDATDSEKLKWKYLPEGKDLAMKYLKGEASLEDGLSGYSGESLSYVKEGIEEVLADQIVLPSNDKISPQFTKALDGIVSVKEDKPRAQQIASAINQLMDHFVTQGAEQRKQAADMLKESFAGKLKAAATQKRLSIDTSALNVEALPQYHEELSKVVAQINEQYQIQLSELKRYLTETD